MCQNANVAGRDFHLRRSLGSLAAVNWTPTLIFTFTANYIHADLDSLPDFGVPYYAPAKLRRAHFRVNVPRDTFYGFVNRDFQKATQDVGTLTGEAGQRQPDAQQQIPAGTLGPRLYRHDPGIAQYHQPNPLLWTVSANPQSRYQVTNVIADQTEVKFKYNIGPFQNTAIAGVELSREHVYRHLYGPRVGSLHRRVQRQRLARRQYLQPSINLIPFPNLTGPDRQSDRHPGRHQERLSDRHRQLSGSGHPQRRRAVRRLQCHLIQQPGLAIRPIPAMFNYNGGLVQAAADRQLLRRLCHVFKSGRRRTRRHRPTYGGLPPSLPVIQPGVRTGAQ